MTYKRISSSLFIIIICMMMFLTGYVKTASLNCYAAENWQDVTTNEQLVKAFRAYCKSRDLTIDGSIADGVTKFTTETFNGICNTLGIDVTALQAHLKYETDNNYGLRFLFDSTGITAYNAIFAQFLQDNNLDVGENYNNYDIYSGKFYKDLDNNACFVYEYEGSSSSYTKKGTFYKVSENEMKNYYLNDKNTISLTCKLSSNVTYNLNLYYIGNNIDRFQGYYNSKGSSTTGRIYGEYFPSTNYHGDPTYKYYGTPIILYNINSGKYFLGTIGIGTNGNVRIVNNVEFVPNNSSNCNIFINTINVINNNNYQGDTIINNNGDHNTDEPIPDDPTVPDYDPYPDGDPNPTPPSDVGGGEQSDDTNITFPNFEFNFPEIDWSLGDLSEKFPFSIPFDLIAFFTALNAEPQAPSIDADIPLGNWYTWHFEADFSQFDRYASIVRNVEFIGFVVGLIYFTIRLAKG